MRTFQRRLTLRVKLNGKEKKFTFRVEEGVKNDYIRLFFPKTMEVFDVNKDTVGTEQYWQLVLKLSR